MTCVTHASDDPYCGVDDDGVKSYDMPYTDVVRFGRYYGFLGGGDRDGGFHFCESLIGD